MEASSTDRGNLKRLKFYVCPDCGNTITSTSEAEISCCGRILSPLVPKPADEAHRMTVEESGDERYITSGHGMSKGHYISFIAAVDTDRVFLIKLYPEQDCAARLPAVHGGKLCWYCTEHGLWTMG
jgi:desulfoferrodoxin (superoxide reductase-like protein)